MATWTPRLEWWKEVLSHHKRSEIEKLLAALHGKSSTDVGSLILRAIGNWNSIHGVVGLRDSNTTGTPSSPWKASLRVAGPTPFERPIKVGSSLDTRSFGYFGLGDTAPAGAWATVRQSAVRPDGTAQEIVFRRKLEAGTPLVVDLLGAAGTGDVSIFASNGQSVGEMQVLCDNPEGYSSSTGRALADCESIDNASYRVSIAAGDDPRSLEVALSPVSKTPAVLFDAVSANGFAPVSLAWAPCGANAVNWHGYIEMCSDDGWSVYGDGRPLVLLCRRADDPENPTECAADWNELPNQRDDTRPLLLDVLAADDEALISLGPERPNLSEPDREMSAQLQRIQALGLHPLFGAGPADSQGLLGALWRKYTRIPAGSTPASQAYKKTIKLSIDPAIQAALIDVIEKETTFSDGAAVSFTVLDASGRCWDRGQDGCRGRASRGAIKAAYAGTIKSRPGVGRRARVDVDFSRGIWNYLAAGAWRERVGYGANSLASFAWASAGSAFAPGSTFKPVTALAAIEHVVTRNAGRMEDSLRGRKTISDALAPGRMPPGVNVENGYVEFPYDGALARRTPKCGPSRNAVLAANRSRICNLTQPVLIARSISSCGTETAKMFGLCEAIRKSVNNYFLALALAMEEAAPSHLSGGDGDPAVVEMARRLVPDFYGMLPQEDLGNRWSRFNGNGFVGIGSSESQGATVSRLFALGQNAFGQDLQANTASMAAVYAAIATGCRTTPWLSGGEQRCQPIFEGSDREIANAFDLMQKTLVAGLISVVNHGGTLSSYMGNRPWRANVRGKTGTAQIGNGLHTAWVSGWIEGDGDDDRYAFACMVTETTRQGGEVCGPIVRKVLARIAEPSQ